MQQTSPTFQKRHPMVSLLLQGSPSKESATSTFQAFLESKKYKQDANGYRFEGNARSAVKAGTTWFVRQTLTPVMAVVELGVRVTQFVLVTLFNFVSGSLFAKRI